MSGFEQTEFIDIPIMPYDLPDAIQWRDWLIKQEIKEGYFNKYDFEKLVIDINNKNGLIPYQTRLDIPNVISFREKITKKSRTKQDKEFWHITATEDLNPDNNKTYIEKTIDIEDGKRLSFFDIVSRIKNNITHPVQKIFYYDKFVINEKQQKAMIAFFDAWQNNAEKILITNMFPKEQTREQLIRQNEHINEVDLTDIFSNRKTLHDRYIIVYNHYNEYSVFKLSNSIDYIKFNTNNITAETIGILNESISFNRVEKKMLKKEMVNFIETY
jgi:hypothetical protein